MAVLECAQPGCGRLISRSRVSGGNPVASRQGAGWAQAPRDCPRCGAVWCEACPTAHPQQCVCGAPLAGDAVRAGLPNAAAWQAQIDALMPLQDRLRYHDLLRRSLGVALVALLLATALLLARSWLALPAMVVGVACGAFAAWMQTDSRASLLMQLLGLLLPGLNVLLAGAMYRRAGNEARQLGLRPTWLGVRVQDEDVPVVEHADAGPTLQELMQATPPVADQVPVEHLLDEAAAQLAEHAGLPLRPYANHDFGRERDASARSIIVDKTYAQQYVRNSRQRPLPGLQFYLGTTRWLGEEQPGHGKVELAVVEGEHPTDILRVARTHGLNAGIDAATLQARMRDYHARYGVEVLAAETDTLQLRFIALPQADATLQTLAGELLELCPDIALMVGSGDADTDRIMLARMLQQSGGELTLWWD